MKKRVIIYILILSAAAACQMEIYPDRADNASETLVDKVFTTDASTKTVLSGSSVLWTGSEKVSVFDGKANRRFSVWKGRRCVVILPAVSV